jgi:hypothetical protein
MRSASGPVARIGSPCLRAAKTVVDHEAYLVPAAGSGAEPRRLDHLIDSRAAADT